MATGNDFMDVGDVYEQAGTGRRAMLCAVGDRRMLISVDGCWQGCHLDWGMVVRERGKPIIKGMFAWRGGPDAWALVERLNVEGGVERVVEETRKVRPFRNV